MDVKVTPKYDKDYQQTLWTVECKEKRPDPFYVVPNPMGYVGFIIKTKTGELPAVLSGSYTRHTKAVEAIKLYYNTMQRTVKAKREARAEDRKKDT